MLCAAVKPLGKDQPCLSLLIKEVPSHLIDSPPPQGQESSLTASDGDKLFLDSPRKKKRCRKCQQNHCCCTRSAGQETSLAMLDLPLSPVMKSGTKKRGVCFARDGKGKILRQYQAAPFPFPETPKEESKLWYTTQEYRLFKYDAKRDLKKANDNDKRQFIAVYNACKTADGLRSIHTTDSAALAAASYRGLEHILFRSLHKRKPVIHSVIQKQAELMDDELSNLSRSLSQRARRIARVLGNGDAHVARGAAVARVAATQ